MDCHSEVVIRVRRELASSSDRVALEAHLAACESCRLSFEFGRAFDCIGVELDDAARVERLASSARARWALKGRASGFRQRARRFRVALLAAACVLGVGVAGATFGLLQPEPTLQPSSSALPLVKPAAPTPGVRSLAPRRESAAQAEPPAATANAPRRNARAMPARSATALFKEANEARRRGQIEQATALYTKLQSDFPKSPQAVMSAVSLGGLLLSSGRSDAALVQFERYLQQSRAGGLAAEAL
ncbi:MAG TPA: tetratricopeptide repeat protein, partial [Polyangiaceae bacterium]|nr:tetratricopeptide repeat protein [Polyangiaceae bacterium]